MKSGWMLFLLLVLSLAACGPLPDVSIKPEQPTAVLGINEGNLAPDFQLTTVDGAVESLYKYRGQPVLINFFTTWCGPCMVEMPDIEAAYRTLRPQGLVILAIDLGENPDVIIQMRQSKGLTFPLLLDPNKVVGQSYHTSFIPRSFFIDANGVIRKVVNSAQDESQIAENVNELFKYGGRVAKPTKKPAAKPPEKAGDEPGITGCVNINSALARSGPGSSFPSVRSISHQTCLRYDARSEDGAWLRLSRKESNGMHLWVAAEYISLQGEPILLPIAE